MGQVSITLNGRTYRLRCGDGEESRLLELSAHLRDKIERLTSDFGQVGDDRLMIMAALLITDELFEARARLSELQTTDPSLYAPLDDAPPAPKVTPPALPVTLEAPAAPPAVGKIVVPAMPQPLVPVTPEAPSTSLKRALQRPQGKTTLSQRLAEARETVTSGERPAQSGPQTGRKAGNA